MSRPADWCPTCEERTGLTDRGVCSWCDTPLVRRKGGWTRPDLRGGRIPDAHLKVLYQAHITKLRSINSLAKQIHARYGYKSHHSTAVAISNGWKRLGLQARDRLEMAVLASTKHGLAPKHGSRAGYGTYRRRVLAGQDDRPLCKAVRASRPRKGEPCQVKAQHGSECCWAHDPARRAEREAATAAMRARQPVEPVLPAGPFIAWLWSLHAELGAWRRVADAIGMHPTQAHRWAHGRDTGTGKAKTHVTVRVVERSAANAGTTVDAIYGGELDDRTWDEMPRRAAA